MVVTLGVVSSGKLGRALGALEGIQSGSAWTEVCKGTDAVLVEAESGSDLAALRASVVQGPALLLVAGHLEPGEGGELLLCPEPDTPPETVAAVSEFLQGAAEVEVVSPEQLTVAVAFQAAAPVLMNVALGGLKEGAVESGLPAETAQVFAQQTLLGTALLLEEEHASPAELKDQVASPAGTTIAGLAVLEEAAIRGSYIRSVLKSCLSLGQKG